MAEIIMVVYLSGFLGGAVFAGIWAIEYIARLKQKYNEHANRNESN